jgi:hypothetical protein
MPERAGEFTNVNIALLDDDQGAVDLEGDVSDLLAAGQLCIRPRYDQGPAGRTCDGLSTGARRREQLLQRDLRLERVREHLIAGDDVSVEQHCEE